MHHVSLQRRRPFVSLTALLPALTASLLAMSVAGCASDLGRENEGATDSIASPLPIDDPTDPTEPDPPDTDPPPPSVDRFAEAVARYNGYDYDGDGIKEIESLSQLAYGSSTPSTPAPKGMVVVVVDPRILAGSAAYSPGYVQIMLDMWGSDLRAEGYDPRFVKMKVRRNSALPDGTTVLSMRRFLRDVKPYFNLSGAILVGDFPEPTLLRSTLTRGEVRNGPATIGTTTVSNVDTLNLNAELIALRSDLVLADLDGGWESVYRPNMTFRQVTIVPTNGAPSSSGWPQPNTTYTGTVFSSRLDTFEDVFFIRDETATTVQGPSSVQIAVNSGVEPGPELAASDRALTNPIARPEISVTRINARHVGRRPVNALGESALDANGVPKTVAAGNGSIQSVRWVDDAETELRVLMDFFRSDRAFRNGGDNALPFRTGAVRGPDSGLADPSAYNAMLRPAHTALSATPSLIADHQDLIGYLTWLEQPAVLRGIISHASASIAVFTDASVPVPSNAQTVAKVGTPWRWVRNGANLEPSFVGVGSGQMEVYRALWENGKLAGKGQRFYVHNGCEVNSPANGSTASYVDEAYAELQNGESQLFFTNGLAVLARAKVFFDSPRNVGTSIAQKGNFGGALAGYVAADAADSSLAPLGWSASGMARRERALQRKKTYFWSVIGDYTLRMKY